MAKHEVRSFSGSLISGAVEPFPMDRRIDRMGQRADRFVVLAVLAFVVGFLSLFTFAAARNAPESLAKDNSLLTMYGP